MQVTGKADMQFSIRTAFRLPSTCIAESSTKPTTTLMLSWPVMLKDLTVWFQTLCILQDIIADSLSYLNPISYEDQEEKQEKKA
jgi:hypothetical protein